MALKLNTGKLSIKNLGINLDQRSTQDELSRALELEPKLNVYIVESKTIKTNGTKKEESKA
jgi:hypothetical protein